MPIGPFPPGFARVVINSLKRARCLSGLASTGFGLWERGAYNASAQSGPGVAGDGDVRRADLRYRTHPFPGVFFRRAASAARRDGPRGCTGAGQDDTSVSPLTGLVRARKCESVRLRPSLPRDRAQSSAEGARHLRRFGSTGTQAPSREATPKRQWTLYLVSASSEATPKPSGVPPHRGVVVCAARAAQAPPSGVVVRERAISCGSQRAGRRRRALLRSSGREVCLRQRLNPEQGSM